MCYVLSPTSSPPSHLQTTQKLLLAVSPTSMLQHLFSLPRMPSSALNKLLLILQEPSLKVSSWTSLVAQWLRIHLPMQGTWVRTLAWEDPTCHRATKLVHHNY